MLSRRGRAAVVPAAVVALLLGGSGAAWAGDDIWGGVDCDQGPVAGCELFALSVADRAFPWPAGEQSSVQCHYERTDQGPGAGGAGDGAAHGEGPGGWYVYRCPGIADSGPVWIQDSAGGGGGQGAPVSVVAQRAYRQLRLPSPVLRSSPAGPKLVHLPTWLWISPQGWGSRSATVSAPGVSVTATATAQRVVWSMGDGHQVICTAPGTPYPSSAADPASASPDCGHTYRAASSDRPGGVFPVTATTFWAVRWSGAGQAGEFPELTTSSSTAMQVRESPVLNTR